MTTLCMADYSDPLDRATTILRDTKGFWVALTNHASSKEGAEIAGILQAVAEHSEIVHHLIYDIASRDIELAVTSHREGAQSRVEQENATRPNSRIPISHREGAQLRVEQEVSRSFLHRSAGQINQTAGQINQLGTTELRGERGGRSSDDRIFWR